MQVQDHDQIQPAFTRPDVTDIARLLPDRVMQSMIPRGATMTNVQTDLFQFLGHTWPAITAKAEARLFFDMRQCDQIGSLSTAGGAAAKRSQAARADTDDVAQPIGRKAARVLFNKPKSHCFRPAKNCPLGRLLRNRLSGNRWPFLESPAPP